MALQKIPTRVPSSANPRPEVAGLFFFEKHPAGKPLSGAKFGNPRGPWNMGIFLFFLNNYVELYNLYSL
jgi:hypothetical protein